MPAFEEIYTAIEKVCAHGAARKDENANPKAVRINGRDLLKVMQELLKIRCCILILCRVLQDLTTVPLLVRWKWFTTCIRFRSIIIS